MKDFVPHKREYTKFSRRKLHPQKISSYALKLIFDYLIYFDIASVYQNPY